MSGAHAWATKGVEITPGHPNPSHYVICYVHQQECIIMTMSDEVAIDIEEDVEVNTQPPAKKVLNSNVQIQ